MTTPYLFAMDLPIEARRAACDAEYWLRRRGRIQRVRRTTDWACPMGVALQAANLSRVRMPSGNDIVRALRLARGTATAQSAHQFVDDWDTGVLTPADLPVALGVDTP